MRRRRSIILAIFLACAALWFWPPGEVCAQQNLFNMPVPVVAPAHEVFFQEQLNLSRFGSSNLTLDYGLGNNFEIGLNILDVDLYPGDRTLLPGAPAHSSLLLNGQKVFEPNESWEFGIGMQQGLSAHTASGDPRYVTFNWCSVEYDAPDDQGRYLVGAYLANSEYAGKGHPVGLMLGTELPIVKDKLHFVADWLIGDNDISVAVIGGVIDLPRDWQLSLGAQIPSPGSHNDYGAVIELTRTAGARSRGRDILGANLLPTQWRP